MIDHGYDAFNDPYCYKRTTVLKNRLGIRDAVKLQEFEVEVSSLRAEEPLPSGRFGTAHYRAVHHHLFQDVYRWAGRYRTVRISKGDSPFCFCENIDAQMEKLFRKLKEDGFLRGRLFEKFISGAAAFLGELNAIHPFREGNGRAQLSFLRLLSVEVGHPLDLKKVKRAGIVEAMIASYKGDLSLLVAELTKLRTR